MGKRTYEPAPSVLDGGTRDWLTAAETAKLIRRALAERFPGVAFSVRSRTYAGGASVDVHWTDGPSGVDVQGVIQRFEGATFDGMVDLKSYRGPQTVDVGGVVYRVRFGADYVFGHRAVSEAARLNAAAYLERRYGVELDPNVYHQVLAGYVSDAIHRVLHAADLTQGLPTDAQLSAASA